MNQHKRVVKETLNFLYARITGPSASDRERHRIALVALEQLSPSEPTFDMNGATVAQIQTAVEAKVITAADALKHEYENANRKTLVSWLLERDA